MSASALLKSGRDRLRFDRLPRDGILAAFWMMPATTSGLDTYKAWLPGASVTSVPERLAMKRCVGSGQFEDAKLSRFRHSPFKLCQPCRHFFQALLQ